MVNYGLLVIYGAWCTHALIVQLIFLAVSRENCVQGGQTVGMQFLFYKVEASVELGTMTVFIWHYF